MARCAAMPLVSRSGSNSHGKRVDAGDHLHRLVSSLINGPSSGREGTPIGHLAGLDVHAVIDRRFDEVSLTIADVGAEIRWPTGERRNVGPASLVQRLERRIQDLDSALTEARADQAASSQEAERARDRIGAPFEHEERLGQLRRRQQEIDEQIRNVDAPAPEVTGARRVADRLANTTRGCAALRPPSL